MTAYVQLTKLNRNFGICHFNSYLRVTFVSEGWLIVWDHRDRPPVRYDCKAPDHQETCMLAATKLRELAMM